MKTRNNMICLMIIVTLMLNIFRNDRYDQLEKTSVKSVKQSDMPREFTEKALDTINEFIQKTNGLDYEVVLYFDYITGEIIDCSFGEKTKVKIMYDEGEFEGKHVASIHNHSANVFSPPSYDNFGILTRKFEDYELIAGHNSFWILESKGVHINLVFEFKFMAKLFFRAAFDDSRLNHEDWEKMAEECDKSYGNVLSKYINDKNINGIQLSKKEYEMMDANSNSNVALYPSIKRIYDPEELRKSDERIANPNMLTGKDAVFAFYRLMGMEISYDEIFSD